MDTCCNALFMCVKLMQCKFFVCYKYINIERSKQNENENENEIMQSSKININYEKSV